MLEALLTGNGFVVDQALNGEEALVRARQNKPDMIISDILMPVMDGFALCRNVKMDDTLKDVGFVFYTASYLDKRDRDLSLNLGVDRYLTKPQETEKLLEIFNEVLDESSVREQSSRSVVKLPEDIYLKEHNESLVRMLEKKLEQLAISKRILEQEIVVRRDVEMKLQASLFEKEVLLKEVYHRTKNNMQVIVGLFDLQQRKAGSSSLNTVFKEMSDRIYSMSMVHDLLYRSKNFSEINLKNYLLNLSNRLIAVYESPEVDVELVLDSDSIPINIQFATPLGLVITEILSNSLKYAFVGRSQGKITITARFKAEIGLLLTIGDDGVGVGKDFDTQSEGTLGLYIIRTLVENQLYGGLSTTYEKGLTYSIVFPDLLLDIKTH